MSRDPWVKDLRAARGLGDGVIHKYRLPIADYSDVAMPKGAKVLSVGVQNGADVVVWARIERDAETISHRFWLLGTGNPIPTASNFASFIGTVQIPSGGGELVLHVFDDGEVPF